jgi:hypothetical protein
MTAASRFWSIALLLSVAAAITPLRLRADATDAAAAGAASASTQAELATARHRAGVRAFAHHRYRDAIDLFREADRLRPSAALSFNIARCYEQLGDVPNALASYREYLRRADHPDDEAKVTQLVHELEARLARKGVQQVSVSSAPTGAVVAIDGTPMGTSPWTGELVPGMHTLEVTLSGYEPVHRRFELPSTHTLELNQPLTQAQARASPPPIVTPTPAPEVARSSEPATEQAPPPAPPPPPLGPRPLPAPTHSEGASTVGWVALGTGGAVLGGALAFEILRHGTQKDAEHETTQIRFAQDLDRMRSQQLAARVLAGVGAGLVVVGGVLLAVGASSSEGGPSTQVGWSCAAPGCQAQVKGRF